MRLERFADFASMSVTFLDHETQMMLKCESTLCEGPFVSPATSLMVVP